MGLKRTLSQMKDYKIEKKLNVSFRYTLVMMLVSLAVCITGLVYVSTKFNEFYNYYHAISTNTLDSRVCVQGAVKSVAITLLTDDTASIERFQNDAATYATRLGENLNELQHMYRGDTKQIQETIDALTLAGEYRRKLNDFVIAEQHEEALSVYMNEYGPTMTIVQTNMIELDEIASGLSSKAFNKTRVVDKIAMIGAGLISIFSIMVTLGIAKGLILMLRQPLAEVENAAKEMAAGSLNVKLEYQSQDEFGVLADSMRVLCNHIRTIIADIDRVLEELANGNFKVQSSCLDKYIGDYQPILFAMRAIRDRLNETLIRINESAESVAESSVHLARGAQALAEGSTEQAGAVEELTATVEDVSAMAQENAKDAEKAYYQVAEAEKEADKSQQSLYDLTDAMKVISDTSLKIQNIIAAIEDIASQTNLLSLNASIEAARAGEAGKGFAVVADQIGKLAADSARSAVDTKELIVESIEEIQRGNEITEKTVEGLKVVLASIKIFEEISKNTSNTSRKQADMLNQIQSGIEQISTTVQNNSAAAEETSATSQELSLQADSLKNEVKKFKLL